MDETTVLKYQTLSFSSARPVTTTGEYSDQDTGKLVPNWSEKPFSISELASIPVSLGTTPLSSATNFHTTLFDFLADTQAGLYRIYRYRVVFIFSFHSSWNHTGLYGFAWTPFRPEVTKHIHRSDAAGITSPDDFYALPDCQKFFYRIGDNTIKVLVLPWMSQYSGFENPANLPTDDTLKTAHDAESPIVYGVPISKIKSVSGSYNVPEVNIYRAFYDVQLGAFTGPTVRV